MSQKLRNPFRMRASEKIESDANFLRLYSSLAMEGLIEKHLIGKLWENITFIHSSPGAGKTSLLRIFEPRSLLIIHSRGSQEYIELNNILRKLEVFIDDNVEILGVLIACNRNYEVLDDLDLNASQKKRIFFSLINARLILSTLRSLLILKNLQFPQGLEEIKFIYNNEHNYFKKIEVPCTGKELYNWALAIEKDIYLALDSFLPINNNIEGHDELFAFEVLNPKFFLFKDKQVCNRFLFMLDDSHKLSIDQRDSLIKFLIEKRGINSIWISERKEALTPQDNLRSSQYRDYEEINIEKYWQDRPSKFEKILINIATKRASMSTENVNSFQENIEKTWSEDNINESLIKAIPLYTEKLIKLTSYYTKYNDWVDYAVNYECSIYEKALLLKSCEILIYRNIGKPQLDLGFALSKEELLNKKDTNIEDAARFFISREHNLPYYFGFSNLVKLSNNNIEQFLSFSSDIFEEMLSNNLCGYNVVVSPEKQEKIIKKIAESKWKEISRLIPHSILVINFLNQLSIFARKETYKPNAPIIQGVTGFAVANPIINLLYNDTNWENDDLFAPLVNVLSTCIAYNLLEIREVTQGQKGQKFQVFYLNRWLCMKFNLPLAYGGWKAKKTDELIKWTKG